MLNRPDSSLERSHGRSACPPALVRGSPGRSCSHPPARAAEAEADAVCGPSAIFIKQRGRGSHWDELNSGSPSLFMGPSSPCLGLSQAKAHPGSWQPPGAGPAFPEGGLEPGADTAEARRGEPPARRHWAPPSPTALGKDLGARCLLTAPSSPGTPMGTTLRGVEPDPHAQSRPKLGSRSGSWSADPSPTSDAHSSVWDPCSRHGCLQGDPALGIGRVRGRGRRCVRPAPPALRAACCTALGGTVPSHPAVSVPTT